jgi:hypothetical protein
MHAGAVLAMSALCGFTQRAVTHLMSDGCN